MRAGVASLTARDVAIGRSQIERPPWPSGDAGAEERLFASVIGDASPQYERRQHNVGFFGWLQARTRFFDAVLIDALRDDVQQIVILGAGYDGRALRYRTPNVQFFEVDHPATQTDKRQRLREIDASLDGIMFVTADFTKPGLADRLAAAGHDEDRLSLFMCEGVLRYLPEGAYREVLRVSAQRAARGSVLAVSLSTRDHAPDERELAREQALADAGEAVLTVPPRAVALQWVADAGWQVDIATDAADEAPTRPRGRLLVRAHPRE